MSPARRREMVDREHPSLSLVRQCALLGVSRSSIYYRPRAASAEDLYLMGEIDRQYLETPFYGSRRMKAWLERSGVRVSRKRVQRLMRAMGLRAIYRRPSTSRRSPENPVYPYLLRNVRITRPNQVWAADITYLPMARGFLYLVAVMDWHSRYVLAWRLSNTLEAGFCAEALEEALGKGRPGGVQTPTQGSQFHQPGVHPGPPGARGEDQHGREGPVPGQHLRGAAVADGEVRGGVPESLRQRPGGGQRGLEDYFRFYNGLRPHQALDYRTPAEVFHGDQGIVVEGDSNERRGSPGQGIESLAGEPGFSLNSPLILSK